MAMENEQVLAIVGGKQITEADVEGFIATLGQRAQQYRTPQGRAAILEELIGQKLLLLDATRNLFEREPAFQEQLKALKEELLVNYAANKAVSGVRVTDVEAKAYFDEHPDLFKGEETVSASHILVADETQAKAILEEIREGKTTFEEAAKQYSTCPSGKNGGSLGEFGHGQMVPEFDEACFQMEVGELRGPIQTQFGFHIIRLDAKNAAEPVHFGDVRESITRQLTAEKQQAAYRSKINQLKILYPVEKV